MNAIKHTRIPVALLLATALTAGLFTVLQSLTESTFIPVATQSTRIEFKRTRIETPPVTKQREKPVLREAPKVDVILPPGTTEDRTGPGVVLNERIVPETGLGNTPLSNGADRDVSPLVRIDPVYPPRAAAGNIEGWVQVRFNISAAGGVTDVTVVASEPGTVFDKAATDAVARWRYNPKVENAVAVERRGLETVLRFQLE